MRDRLELLRMLLAEQGSIWISIDDNECHYLKVLCDEIFGRQNFVASIIWQKIFSPKSTARHFSDAHDYVLVYAKSKELWQRNLLSRDEKHNKSYKNPDNDPRGLWTSGDLSARNYYSLGLYPITTPAGRVIAGPPKGMYWRVSKDKFEALDRDNRIWWGKDRDNQPRLKRFLSDVMEGIVPQTIWLHQDVGNTQEAKKEVMAAVPIDAEVFQTPKPERLLRRILELSTQPGDWVLDSFAGTGSIGATAHKMRRQWIMIELGDHCYTHILPRICKVVDGTDKGGITESAAWNGGGGFRFYRLAPSLLERDRWDNWIISRQYNAAMLAEAMCKLEGFTYAPSQDRYWQHGHSTERDFIYVTTQKLTQQQLHALSEEVGPERSLLVCCTAFRGAPDQWPNVTLKKIPKAVMQRCEWGRDDYSLAISSLPPADRVDDMEAPTGNGKKGSRSKKTSKAGAPGQPNLFAAEGEQA